MTYLEPQYVTLKIKTSMSLITSKNKKLRMYSYDDHEEALLNMDAYMYIYRSALWVLSQPEFVNVLFNYTKLATFQLARRVPIFL